MACYDYKVTLDYDRPLMWSVSVWRREVLVNRDRGAWSRIAFIEKATLEGHVDPHDRLRQVLRSLAA